MLSAIATAIPPRRNGNEPMSAIRWYSSPFGFAASALNPAVSIRLAHGRRMRSNPASAAPASRIRPRTSSPMSTDGVGLFRLARVIAKGYDGPERQSARSPSNVAS